MRNRTHITHTREAELIKLLDEKEAKKLGVYDIFTQKLFKLYCSFHKNSISVIQVSVTLLCFIIVNFTGDISVYAMPPPSTPIVEGGRLREAMFKIFEDGINPRNENFRERSNLDAFHVFKKTFLKESFDNRNPIHYYDDLSKLNLTVRKLIENIFHNYRFKNDSSSMAQTLRLETPSGTLSGITNDVVNTYPSMTVSGTSSATVSGTSSATVSGSSSATVSGTSSATVSGSSSATVSGTSSATVSHSSGIYKKNYSSSSSSSSSSSYLSNYDIEDFDIDENSIYEEIHKKKNIKKLSSIVDPITRLPLSSEDDYDNIRHSRGSISRHIGKFESGNYSYIDRLLEDTEEGAQAYDGQWQEYDPALWELGQVDLSAPAESSTIGVKKSQISGQQIDHETTSEDRPAVNIGYK